MPTTFGARRRVDKIVGVKRTDSPWLRADGCRPCTRCRRAPRRSRGPPRSGRARSQIVTIRPTPAARARAITASRSSSNCGACRLTWLSISIARGQTARSGAQLADRGEEGVGAVEVEAVDLGGQRRPAASQTRPSVGAARALRGRGDGARASACRPGARTAAANRAGALAARGSCRPWPAARSGRRSGSAAEQVVRRFVGLQRPGARPAAAPARRAPGHARQMQRGLARASRPRARSRTRRPPRSGQGRERQPPAARADGGQQPARRVGDQEQHAAFRRLLQRLQQRRWRR